MGGGDTYIIDTGGGYAVGTMAECAVELGARCRGFSTDMDKSTACCLCLFCV